MDGGPEVQNTTTNHKTQQQIGMQTSANLQPMDGVRPMTAPVALGSGLLGVGLFGNAAQSGW